MVSLFYSNLSHTNGIFLFVVNNTHVDDGQSYVLFLIPSQSSLLTENGNSYPQLQKVLFHNSVLLNLFLFSWASRLGFWTFDNTVSEMCVLEFTEENNKSEPVSHWENLVRII